MNLATGGRPANAKQDNMPIWYGWVLVCVGIQATAHAPVPAAPPAARASLGRAAPAAAGRTTGPCTRQQQQTHTQRINEGYQAATLQQIDINVLSPVVMRLSILAHDDFPKLQNALVGTHFTRITSNRHGSRATDMLHSETVHPTWAT